MRLILCKITDDSIVSNMTKLKYKCAVKTVEYRFLSDDSQFWGKLEALRDLWDDVMEDFHPKKSSLKSQHRFNQRRLFHFPSEDCQTAFVTCWRFAIAKSHRGLKKYYLCVLIFFFIFPSRFLFSRVVFF